MNRTTSLLAALAATSALISPSTVALAQSAASPFTTGYRYDLGRRLVGQISADPDGSGSLPFMAVRNTYDARGNLTRVERGRLAAWQAESVAPASWAGFTVLDRIDYLYDNMGRQTRETHVGGGVTSEIVQTTYDSLGRPLCRTQRMDMAAAVPTSACSAAPAGGYGADRITRFEHDYLDRLVQTRTGVGTTAERAYVTYSYKADGQPLYHIDANGNRTTYVYDGFARLVQMTFPSASIPSGYNPTSAANAVATAGSSNSSDYEEYAFDDNGNRTSYRRRSGKVVGYFYDALNRVYFKDVPSSTSLDVYYAYDFAGNTLYSRFGSTAGAGISNKFNNANRMVSTTDNSTGTSRTINRQFDGDGNQTRVTFPDATYFDYEYDGVDRLVDIYLNASSTPIVTVNYDVYGRRASVNRPLASVSSDFGYDGASRLQTASHDFSGTASDVTFSYAYNPANQLTSRSVSTSGYLTLSNVGSTSYARNGRNQYTTIGADAITHSGGNLTHFGGDAFGYDAENRMTSASGSVAATLTYDPLGRLARFVSGSTDERYLYDNARLVGVYNASNAMLERYVPGSLADEVLIAYSGAATTSPTYYFSDERGSVIAGANSAGAKSFTNSYDEYGRRGSGNNSRYAYTGQVWISQLALYNFKARIYDASIGRFYQTDPAGYDDQPNLYTYVHSDPLRYNDPTGRQSLEWIAPNVGNLTWVYNIDTSATNGVVGFTDAQAASAVDSAFSGQYNYNGNIVTINATARPFDPAIDTPTTPVVTAFINPALPGQIIQGQVMGEAFASDIGGNEVWMAPNSPAFVLAHELGHTAGAGDQYQGGVDANRQRLGADVPGPANIMKNGGAAPANDQTVKEILDSPDVPNTCSAPGNSANGRC